VILFDSKPGWNQVGGPELLAPENHGGKGCNILFGNFEVKFIEKEKFGELKWDIEVQSESAEKLRQLGSLLLLYGNFHEERYPDTLNEVQEYGVDEKDLQWFLQNVEYLGKGKTMADPPFTPIAYDKSLLKKDKAINVLLNDCGVTFRTTEQLKKLGIK